MSVYSPIKAIGLTIEYYVVEALGIVCYNENINHEHEDKNHFLSPLRVLVVK